VTLDPAGTRLGKRAELRARRRRQRRRLTVAGAIAVVVLLVLVTVVLVRSGGSGGKNVVADTRSQRTILMQVKGTDGSAVASALLAHDGPSGLGAVVLVPPQVLVTVPGGGSTVFGRALKTGGVDGARNALEDLMGVTIDGSWVLDADSFRRLVDQEGGVQVTVDVPVMQGRTIVIPAGPARLAGAQALQFATYLAANEQEQTRLARLQNVLDGVVTGLPAAPETLVKSLGAGAQSTASTSDLAKVLSGLKKDDTASNLQYRSLPVVVLPTGNDDVRFRLDKDASKAMVDELLAQSVPPGVRAEGNRVLVLNGVGTPGLGQKVRAKIVPAGFVFVGSRNADHFGQCCTQVLVKEQTPEGTALGNRVAKALGVPLSSVKSSDQIGSIADVVVIVGKDFKAQ
jgi:hypothetical protein